MTDLTKITTPFGLLDAETQEALRAHGGPYEVWASGGEWIPTNPAWNLSLVTRVKPQPPKPREWWVHPYVNDISSSPVINYVHVREVLSDD